MSVWQAETPAQAPDALPFADLVINITGVESGRRVQFGGESGQGKKLLARQRLTGGA